MDKDLTRVYAEVTQLQAVGLSNQSLPAKISIVTSLLPTANHGKECRYWATTLDSPSQMYSEFTSFFDQQETILRCKDKRRLVVIEERDLDSEIMNPDKRKDLVRFIDWHSSNEFALRFLIGSRSTFAKKADEYIEAQTSKEVVTDFAIFADRWVFGQVDIPSGDPNAPVHHLRLHKAKMSQGGSVHQYVGYYQSIWNRWEGDKWPVLSAEQVRSECIRQSNKELFLPLLAKDYPNHINNNGVLFFADLCNSLKLARSGLFAVDIAPMKSGLNAWINDMEYQSFLDATQSAADAGCPCSRIYVLHQRIFDHAERELVYDKIFRPPTSRKRRFGLSC